MILLLRLLLFVGVTLYTTSMALASDAIQDQDDNSIILAIRADNQILSDAFFAQQVSDSVFLPLTSFLEQLGYTAPEGDCSIRCKGTLTNTNTKFVIDYSTDTLVYFSYKSMSTASVSLVALHKQQQLLLINNDDIYLAIALWEDFLNVSLNWNSSQLQLSMRTHQLMPWQIQARKNKIQKTLRSSKTSTKEIDFQMENDYLDMTYISAGAKSTSKDNNAFFEATTTANVFKHRIDILTKHQNQSSVGQEDDTSSTNLIRISRQLDNNFISDYAIGNVHNYSLPKLHRSVTGNGIIISNSNVSTEPFTELHGELLTNWHAELYKNNQIIAFDSDDDNDGYYHFSEVYLNFGKNVFTIISVSPVGQKRTTTKTIYFDNLYQSFGIAHYRLANIKQEVNGQTYNHQIGSFSFGLTKSVQLFANTWQRIASGQDTNIKSASSIAMRTRIGGLSYFQLDRYIHNAMYSDSITFHTTTPFGNMLINHQQSPKVYQDISGITSYKSTSLSLQANLPANIRMSLSAEDKQSTPTAEHNQKLKIQLRKNFSSGMKLSFTETINKSNITQYTQVLQAIVPLEKAKHTINISGTDNLQAMNYNLQYATNQRATFFATATYNIDKSMSASIGTSLYNRYGSINFQLNKSEFFDTGLTNNEISIQASTLVVHDKEVLTMVNSSSIERSGAITVRVYIETENSKTLISSGRIKINGRPYELQDGTITIGNIAAYYQHTIAYDYTSLPETNLVPEETETLVYISAAEHKTVDIILLRTGEVDGNIYNKFGDIIPYAMMVFIASNNQRYITRSEKDGYFYVHELPMDSYCIYYENTKLQFTDETPACFVISSNQTSKFDMKLEEPSVQ